MGHPAPLARLVATTALSFALLGSPARPLGGKAGPDRWQFEVTPYLWASSLEGRVGIEGTPASDVDVSFGNLIENVDAVFPVAFEARRDRWGFLLDASYMRASADGEVSGPNFGDVDVVVKSFLLEADAAYRVHEGDGLALDLSLGARLWSVDIDIDVEPGLFGGVEVDDGDTWVDPVVGARFRADLGEGFYAKAVGDVGGFSASSDFSWQAFAALGYEPSERWRLGLGYRALAVDFDSGGFVYDVVSHGPILTIGYRF